MLSGQQAVQSRTTTGGTSYTFQATGNVYDLGASATITGHLDYGTTSLAGAEVFAETVDGSGLATIQRRAFSDSFGELHPRGSGHGQPLLRGLAAHENDQRLPWAAAASPVNALTAITYTANLAFSAPQSPGSLTLTITPASSSTQGTWGELRQTLSTRWYGIPDAHCPVPDRRHGVDPGSGRIPGPGARHLRRHDPTQHFGCHASHENRHHRSQVSAGGIATQATLTYP